MAGFSDRVCLDSFITLVDIQSVHEYHIILTGRGGCN